MTKKAIIKDEDKNVIGHVIETRVKKTKNGSYDGSEVYSVNFYNQGGFNEVDEYARMFLETGISEQRGAWIFYASQDGEELKANGYSKFVEDLKEDKETFEFLKSVLNGK
jgi:hypothetical protein